MKIRKIKHRTTKYFGNTEGAGGMGMVRFSISEKRSAIKGEDYYKDGYPFEMRTIRELQYKNELDDLYRTIEEIEEAI